MFEGKKIFRFWFSLIELYHSVYNLIPMSLFSHGAVGVKERVLPLWRKTEGRIKYLESTNHPKAGLQRRTSTRHQEQTIVNHHHAQTSVSVQTTEITEWLLWHVDRQRG